jgi:hypothetical protein
LNGYWDSINKIFQFGTHPDGYLWDVEGNLVISLCTTLQYSKSKWKEKWRKEAIDFLLKQHCLETERVLDQMINSQMLYSILDVDGYAKRTQAKIKRHLVLNTTVDQQDGAGPNGTLSDSMDLTGWRILGKWQYTCIAKKWFKYKPWFLGVIIVF